MKNFNLAFYFNLFSFLNYFSRLPLIFFSRISAWSYYCYWPDVLISSGLLLKHGLRLRITCIKIIWFWLYWRNFRHTAATNKSSVFIFTPYTLSSWSSSTNTSWVILCSIIEWLLREILMSEAFRELF